MTSMTIDFNKSNYFESFIYPDGVSHQVRLTAEGMAAFKAADAVTVIARLSNAADIINLMLLFNVFEAEALFNWKNFRLVLPYLPFSRADRRFVEGDCYGLGFFTDLLLSQFFLSGKIVSLDVHNEDAATGVINVAPTSFIHRAIIETAGLDDEVTILFPDKGASERYALPDTIGNNQRQIKLHKLYCSKKRDAVTGKLLGFDVPVDDMDMSIPALVVDDICDGGGTFVGIADEIGKSVSMMPDLNLWVTHGIFSQGFTKLKERFDRVFTTNSRFQNGPQGFLTVYDSMPALLEAL